MNQQIRQLAEQAGFNLHNDVNDGPSYNYEINKFAELIVKECCRAFWTEECHVSDLAYLDYKEKINKIKQHFGVEE
jgi:endonuclease I